MIIDVIPLCVGCTVPYLALETMVPYLGLGMFLGNMFCYNQCGIYQQHKGIPHIKYVFNLQIIYRNLL